MTGVWQPISFRIRSLLDSFFFFELVELVRTQQISAELVDDILQLSLTAKSVHSQPGALKEAKSERLKCRRFVFAIRDVLRALSKHTTKASSRRATRRS